MVLGAEGVTDRDLESIPAGLVWVAEAVPVRWFAKGPLLVVKE